MQDPLPVPQPRDRAALEALVRTINRPEPALMTLYVIASLLAGPLFLLPLVPLFFRYHTLRYRFEDDGISVSWGILFRREHHLTYRRIQDIHVTRNFLERWLGIGTVSVQTASGSGAAEAEFVGVKDYEEIRDFLYARMRGLGTEEETGVQDAVDDTAALLLEIRDALRDVREHLGRGEAAS